MRDLAGLRFIKSSPPIYPTILHYIHIHLVLHQTSPSSLLISAASPTSSSHHHTVPSLLPTVTTPSTQKKPGFRLLRHDFSIAYIRFDYVPNGQSPGRPDGLTRICFRRDQS